MKILYQNRSIFREVKEIEAVVDEDDNIYRIREYNDSGFGGFNDGFAPLGDYSTKEKAKEIFMALVEAEKNNERVFIMPEDK